MSNIVLASASLRRIDLLQRLRIPFEVIVSDIIEVMDENSDPVSLVISLAQQKAHYVISKLNKESYNDTILVAADTIVVLDGKKIGKPKDSDDAFNTLQLLRGKTHIVYTGVCVSKKIGSEIVQEKTFSETTEVKMRDYTDNDIANYVATNDPLDKAGSYGIQSLGMVLVEGLKGDYYNVEGLPVAKLFCCLKEFGLNLSEFWS